jgi:hypothetical protein
VGVLCLAATINWIENSQDPAAVWALHHLFCLFFIQISHWTIGRVPERSESQHEDSEGQEQNCARYNQYIHTCPMLGAYYFDQHAAESSNCNIDQVSNWEPRRSEINADHRPDFKIDKQKEDVSKARVTSGGHSDEIRSRGPDGRRANYE